MIQDMIETLAAAKVALEENPQLKATINEYGIELDAEKEDHASLKDKHEVLLNDHAQLNRRVKELEAELEAARFREQATMEKLDTVVSTLKGAVNALVPATDPVPAQSEPELVQQPTEVLVTADALWNEPKAPFATRPKSTEGLDENTAEEGTAKAEPDFQETLLQPGLVEEAISEGAKAINALEVNVPEVPKPYLDKPFSFKPDNVSWPDWVAGGGAKPWWLTEAELEKLREAAA